MGARLRAIILYRLVDRLSRAYDWCAARGYEVRALVPAERYEDAWALIRAGEADVIVAASPQALDPARVPRIEVVPPERT